MEGVQVGDFVLGKFHAAHRFCFVQMQLYPLQQGQLANRILVAALGSARDAENALVDRLQIGQGQFGIDDFNVCSRVDASRKCCL